MQASLAHHSVPEVVLAVFLGLLSDATLGRRLVRVLCRATFLPAVPKGCLNEVPHLDGAEIELSSTTKQA